MVPPEGWKGVPSQPNLVGEQDNDESFYKGRTYQIARYNSPYLDKLYIVMAEEHHPRRDGQVDLKSVFIPLLAKTVTVNGMEVETKGYHALFVNAVDLGAKVQSGETKK